MIEIEQRLLDTKIIAIIRGDYRETAIPLVSIREIKWDLKKQVKLTEIGSD